MSKTIKSIWRWVRFGNIKEVIVCHDGGVPSEIEYWGRFKKIVGYYAYGYFDPSLPYKGE